MWVRGRGGQRYARDMSETVLLRRVRAFAEADPRVRAAVLSGSRVNAAIRPDPFQDVDLTLYVRDLPSFTADHGWIDRFGERMILQIPVLMGAQDYDHASPILYLMQFMDGSRLDLGLVPLERRAEFPPESLSRVLLDKDGIFLALPEPHEGDYFPQPPSAQAFADCCNEFWWLAPYAVKGLRRGQLGYAKYHLDTLMRGELLRMLEWAFGCRTGWARNPGKFGARFAGVLPPDWLTRLDTTYAGADAGANWQALLAMTALFREAAAEVAACTGHVYPLQDDERVSAYLTRVGEEGVGQKGGL
ncbi:adenylyltransferase [Deinococcus proteolyticus MRP]|uniref:Adenylyltransferase n=2 Tax=Deinococcaceae TaxID=183710 RepID=F0RJQ6_DEIPM|nr:adenylyltransferase [Deinococcus proteolyticus MRP]